MRKALIAAVGLVVMAQFSWAQASRGKPDLTGFWERKDMAGAGNFGGLDARVPKAVLVPALAAQPDVAGNQPPANAATPTRPGEAYIVTTGRCGGGMPFMMGHSAALDILQTDGEILIIPEMPGTRHIYMDGRPHPPLDAWEPSIVGHSVGH